MSYVFAAFAPFSDLRCASVRVPARDLRDLRPKAGPPRGVCEMQRSTKAGVAICGVLRVVQREKYIKHANRVCRNARPCSDQAGAEGPSGGRGQGRRGAHVLRRAAPRSVARVMGRDATLAEARAEGKRGSFNAYGKTATRSGESEEP